MNRKRYLLLVFMAIYMALTFVTPALAKNDACVIHNGSPLWINSNAVQAHLDHEDTECPADEPTPSPSPSPSPSPEPTVVPCTNGTDHNGPDQDGCGTPPVNGGSGGNTSNAGSGQTSGQVNGLGELWLDVVDGCKTSTLTIFAGTGEDKVEVKVFTHDWVEGEVEWWEDTRAYLRVRTRVEFDPNGDCAAKLAAETETTRLAEVNTGLVEANGDLITERDTALSTVGIRDGQIANMYDQMGVQEQAVFAANACTNDPLQYASAKFADSVKASMFDAIDGNPFAVLGSVCLLPLLGLLLGLGLIALSNRRATKTVVVPVPTGAEMAQKNKDSLKKNGKGGVKPPRKAKSRK